MQVRLHDRWIGMTSHKRRLVLFFLIGVFVPIALCGSLWTFTEYEAHRAGSMLAEAEYVRLGDSEASVLPFVRRYNGFKLNPYRDDLGNRENAPDPLEYDRRLAHRGDYAYWVGVNPWDMVSPAVVQTRGVGRWQIAVRRTIHALPARMRALIGMRDWQAGVQITIRSGRISKVFAVVFVEGRPGEPGQDLLTHEWELADQMPPWLPYDNLQMQSFVVEAGWMEMETTGSSMEGILTPKASSEALESVQRVNLSCLTSVRGCDGFCGLSRPLLQYLNRHPEVPANVDPAMCK